MDDYCGVQRWRVRTEQMGTRMDRLEKYMHLGPREVKTR